MKVFGKGRVLPGFSSFYEKLNCRAIRHHQMLLAMKLTVVLLTVALVQVQAGAYSQNVTISGKDLPLKAIFKAIKAQTGYAFFYNNELLKDARPVSMDVRDAPLESVLELCFADQPLGYQIENRTVFVTKRLKSTPVNTASNLQPGGALVLPIDIRGRITDSNGMPLEGVNVVVKGTKKGVVTGVNGEFVLKGVSDGTVLVISNIGYETSEIRVVGTQEVKVSLRAVVKSLIDVVVNKGYYNTTDRLNTGDVTTIKGEDIQKQPVSDPILALEGRVPGLYIQQNSGIAGAYSSIMIRGQSSIVNGNDPLYIVDGVPFNSVSLTNTAIGGGALGTPLSYPSNNANVQGGQFGGQGMSPFNSLNPADIENVEVLKDADATAIYGSRGGNGVVLITTRKGKAGKTKFDLNVYSGSSQITREMKLLNTQQYLEMRREAFANDGLSVPSITTDPSDPNYDINGAWDTTRYTDWQKTLIGGTARFTNVQAEISGGSNNTQFLIGGGYTKQGTVFPGDFGDQKVSGRLNLNHASSDQLFHLQLTTNYMYDNNKVAAQDLTGYINIAPDAPALYNSDGTLNSQLLNGTYTWWNPLLNENPINTSATNNILNSLVLSYRILKGFEVKSSFGYNYADMNQNQPTLTKDMPPPYNTDPSFREILIAENKSTTWNIEPQINYHGAVGKGNLNVLVGGTFQQMIRNSTSYGGIGFSSDALVNNPAAGNTTFVVNNFYSQYNYESVFGRLGYEWEEKYLLNITARRDGSSRFGPDKQFGNFGMIAAGWIFTKEEFMKSQWPFLSFGKLRASYGTSGNDQIGDYQFLSTYSTIGSSYQGLSALQTTQLTNPALAWETTRKLEGGLEIGFLNDRIFLSASYYRNRSNNQLINYTLPWITGFGGVQQNFAATVQNSGGEFVLTTMDVKNNNFSWRTSINLTVPVNKLIEFPGLAETNYRYSLSIGQPISIAKVVPYKGVDPTTGLYTFITKDGSGIPSYPQDLTSAVVLAPKLYGGIDNALQYKAIKLDFLIQFSEQTKPNYFESFQMPGLFNYNEPTYVLNRWQKPGQSVDIEQFSTSYSSAAATGYYNIRFPSSHMYSDASFLRLKNVALSYELPQTWQKSVHLQNVQVYIQCQNLFTITSYKGMDPETGPMSLPPLRTITAGLKIAL